MRVRTRRATIEDLEAILDLSKGLFDFEEQFGHENNLNWPHSEDGQKYFKERLEKDTAIPVVAEVDGQIVGYIMGSLNTYTWRRVNPICDIENMFIKEEYRDKGIGSMLVDEVKKFAKEKGVKRMRVGAITQNEKAVAFYKSHGFGDVHSYMEIKIDDST